MLSCLTLYYSSSAFVNPLFSLTQCCCISEVDVHEDAGDFFCCIAETDCCNYERSLFCLFEGNNDTQE